MKDPSSVETIHLRWENIRVPAVPWPDHLLLANMADGRRYYIKSSDYIKSIDLVD